MSTLILSSANVTDVNLVLKERTHMRLCLNMLIFTHNLGNWLITVQHSNEPHHSYYKDNFVMFSLSLSSIYSPLTNKHSITQSKEWQVTRET